MCALSILYGWMTRTRMKKWMMTKTSFLPSLAHCLASGERFRDILWCMMFQEKSYIKGQLSWGVRSLSKEQESR